MSILKNWTELGHKHFADADPMAMIYFVTKACNCSCAHCFYWESLNKPRSKELTLEELEKITSGLGKLLYLRLSGGEPFVRKDLFEIVRLFVAKCRPSYIGIPTNGYFMERIISFAEKVKTLDTRIEIGISIDDLGEHHDKIRGPKNLFQTAVGTFLELKKIKSPNLRVGFITTVMKSNQARLFQLFDYLKSLEPDSIACNMIRDDTLVKEEKEIDFETSQRFSDLCDEYNDRRSKQRFDWFQKLRQAKTLYAHEIRRKVIQTNEFQIPCVAGNKIVVLYAEGEIHPCETLGYEIGNIRDYDYDIKKILQSERAKYIREKIIKEHCFCTHECFTSASIVLSKKQMAKVVMKTLVRPVRNVTNDEKNESRIHKNDEAYLIT